MYMYNYICIYVYTSIKKKKPPEQEVLQFSVAFARDTDDGDGGSLNPSWMGGR